VEARFAPEAVRLLLPCSLFFALLCLLSRSFVFCFFLFGKDKEGIAVRLGIERKPCRLADVGKERGRRLVDWALSLPLYAAPLFVTTLDFEMLPFLLHKVESCWFC
jgi:hypothetical protein